MNSAERIQLSKLMSYLLRHRPDEAGLTLDENGLVPLTALLAAIRLRSGYAWVTAEDIREVVATSEKQRFRLVGVTGCRTLATRNGGVRQPVRECIGAHYGHSQRVRPVAPGTPVVPPELLYHGTARRAVPAILAAGLQPRGRQFVHLSATPDSARRVGRRRDDRPALLVIHARSAHADGLLFYAPTPDVYLVSHVPAAYITLAPE
jgi:putative RNA 2'-phosphotransferase